MIAIFITLAIVVFDQVSKYIVVSYMEMFSEKPFIPYLMSFYRTENRGAAFSMLEDNRWVFMLVSSVAIIAISIVLYYFRGRHPLLTVSLSMVLGGGIGNMIDRVCYGAVVDFLRFDFVDFAIFNVADSFITVGTVLMFVYVLFFETKVEERLRLQGESADDAEGAILPPESNASAENAEEE